MDKYKPGLHKQVSSIFDGVPIPQNSGPQEPDYGHASEAAGHVARRPAFLDADTSYQREPQQAMQSQPGAITAERRKVDREIRRRRSWWQQACKRINSKLFGKNSDVGDKRQKTMAILVPILFVTLIFVLTRVFGPPLRKTRGSEGTGPANMQAAAPSEIKIDWQIPEPYPTALRDPMQLSSVVMDGSLGVRLSITGIVYSEDYPAAAVNGQIVHEGDKISGATVVKITKDSVEFEMNGKMWTQKVNTAKTE
jgi:hypothetical protein